MIDEKKIEEAAEKYLLNVFNENVIGNADFKEYIRAFKDGINWFQENLWHDAMEQPKHGLILVEFNGDMEPLFALHQPKEYTKLIHVYRWLYIEDLMKGGK